MTEPVSTQAVLVHAPEEMGIGPRTPVLTCNVVQILVQILIADSSFDFDRVTIRTNQEIEVAPELLSL